MRIAFGSRINTNLSQLTQLSSTFKKWWDTPGDKGKPSRKEQFQQLLKERPKIVEQVLRSLDGYLAKPLTSRHTQKSSQASAEYTQHPTPAGALSKVVKELDAVLQEYSTKPLPKPPSQTFPKAMHLPSKPLPKIPTQALPKPPTKPLPPIPLSDAEAASNIAALKQALEDAMPTATNTFQKGTAPKTEQKAALNLGQQRIEKPQQVAPQEAQTQAHVQSPLPPKQANLSPLGKARERAEKLPDLPKNRPLPQPPQSNTASSSPTQTHFFAAKRPKYVPKHTEPSAVVQKILASGEGSIGFNEIMGMNKQIQTLHKEVELLADLAYVLGRGMGKDREELFQYAYNNNANLKDKPETQETYHQNVLEHSAKLQGILDKYGILPEKETYNAETTETRVGELIQKLEKQAEALETQVSEWYENNPLR